MADERHETMHQAAVELRWFRPLATGRWWRSDSRTHRKLLVGGDAIGLTGGVGIASEWEGDALTVSRPVAANTGTYCLQGPGTGLVVGVKLSEHSDRE